MKESNREFEYSIEGGMKQKIMVGERGRYVVREYKSQPVESRWSAIQLFGATGAIAGVGPTPEVAFNTAEA